MAEAGFKVGALKSRSVVDDHLDDDSRLKADQGLLIGDLAKAVDCLPPKRSGTAVDVRDYSDMDDAAQQPSRSGTVFGAASDNRARSRSKSAFRNSKTEAVEQKMAEMAGKISGHLKKKFKNLRAKIQTKENNMQ